MKKLLLLLTFTLVTIVAAMAQGTIRGKVTDGTNGEPIMFGTVQVVELSKGVNTDMDGNYSIENIDAGTYTLEFTYVGYAKLVVSEVKVTESEETIIDAKMSESAVTIGEEILVTAKQIKNTENYTVTLQKKAPGLLSAISSKEFSRSGASNAASAVGRVSGVSIEGGKYVYVRGLGDRYSSTALNGARVPGLDPERNSVQMDLFPTNIVDNIVVYKTFMPDLPGNFTGGFVDIITKDFPESFTSSLSLGIGANTLSTFSDNFMTYEGGKTDWLAFDDGTRAIPNIGDIPRANAVQTDEAGVLSLRESTLAFSQNLERTTSTPLPNGSFSYSLGNQFDLGGAKKLGVVGGVSYKRSTSNYSTGSTGRYTQNGKTADITKLNPELLLTDQRSQDNVLWAALLGTSLKLSDGHKIGFNVLHTRSAGKDTRFQSGQKLSDNPDLFYEVQFLGFVERSLTAYQLKGEHAFSKDKGNMSPKIEWITSYTNSIQDEPDLRTFIYGYELNNDGSRNYSIEPSIGKIPTRYFRNMNEYNWDNKVDFTLPFKMSDRTAKFKAGAAFLIKDRDFTERQYEYAFPESQAFSGSPNEYIDPSNVVNWDNGYQRGVLIQENYIPKNTYNGAQDVTSGYLMADLPITDRLQIITGVRVENTVINLSTLDESAGKVEDRVYTDFLPSINIKYDLLGDSKEENSTKAMNLRAAYTRTLARPSFRELAPFAIQRPQGNYTEIGNPNLERTLIDNVDLRWEYYPAPKELISAAVFYKGFTAPIERTFNPVASNPELTYRNAEKATLVGAELEYKKGLGFITPKLNNLFLGTNFTYVYSRVDVDETEAIAFLDKNPDAELERSMFGQSPYIINALLSYDDRDEDGRSKNSFNLSFNVFGPRLSYVIVDGSPNVFEMPRPMLNLNYNRQITSQLSAKISGTNLLNSTYREVQTFKDVEYNYQANPIGMTFSAGITYNFK